MDRADKNTRKFSSKTIRSVIANGILYMNEMDKIEFVDFSECYQAWLDYELTHFDRYDPPMSEGKFRMLIEEWKEIGARNALDEPPWMTFYTDPRIQFVFETYEEISEFRRKLWELGGWSTFDLA